MEDMDYKRSAKELKKLKKRKNFLKTFKPDIEILIGYPVCSNKRVKGKGFN
jgi:hypothetical protein